MNIYDKITRLCNNNGISISKLCLELGLTKTAAHGWKNGSTPSKATLFKIADYFHISIDYFNEDNDDVMRQAQFENDMKMELFGTIDVSDYVMQEVRDYAKYFYDKNNDKN